MSTTTSTAAKRAASKAKKKDAQPVPEQAAEVVEGPPVAPEGERPDGQAEIVFEEMLEAMEGQIGRLTRQLLQSDLQTRKNAALWKSKEERYNTMLSALSTRLAALENGGPSALRVVDDGSTPQS